MTIKLSSPCPDDDGRTPMSNKKFIAPKKKFAPIDISNMDFELEKAKLDVLDETGKLNLVSKSSDIRQKCEKQKQKERQKKHNRKGWITIDAKPGSLKNEGIVKDVIKHVGIKPLPASTEIFQITPELVDLLIRLQWVGVKENKIRILTKDHQISLDY